MRYLFILCLLTSLVSCKTDTKQDSKTASETSEDYDVVELQDEGSENNIAEGFGTISSSNTNEDQTTIEGTYMNTSNEDAETGCNSITVNYSSATPICIDAEGITINVRYSRSGNQTNMYYDSLVENKTDKEVPFNTFDKNIPIAVISNNSSGNLTLDWKGFSINGDLATDYAILGKKNLEGEFKKQ